MILGKIPEIPENPLTSLEISENTIPSKKSREYRSISEIPKNSEIPWKTLEIPEIPGNPKKFSKISVYLRKSPKLG